MSKPIDTDKDGVDDNQAANSNVNQEQELDKIKSGLGNLSDINDTFFDKANKDDTARSGLQLGLAADAIGKGMDSAISKDMANFQSNLYKDNSKFGADLQYDFDAKTRADEARLAGRSFDQQFNLHDEYQNRQFARGTGMEQVQGEQRRKDIKETDAQGRFTYEFQDTVDAKGEERDSSRAHELATGF